jgi:hypothetical protein
VKGFTLFYPLWAFFTLIVALDLPKAWRIFGHVCGRWVVTSRVLDRVKHKLSRWTTNQARFALSFWLIILIAILCVAMFVVIALWTRLAGMTFSFRENHPCCKIYVRRNLDLLPSNEYLTHFLFDFVCVPQPSL